MQLDTTIFKAYDIRGVYPAQINASLVYRIAQAYARFISADANAGRGPLSGRSTLMVAVGHDIRLSGEEFSKAVIEGLTDAGIDVVDLGLVSTDTLYFAVPFLELDGGIMVTASHNPKEFGGLKLVREKGRPISGDTGIEEIKNLVVDHIEVKSDRKGQVVRRNVTDEYIAHVLRPFNLKAIKPMRVVANANFGMVLPALDKLQQYLPLEVAETVNGRLDGNFPKGRPDPLIPSNRDETIAAIKTHKPDLGVAWDGDADRVFFFDEQGNFVPPAYISALIAKYFLRKYSGAKILHDTRIVRVIDAAVKEYGGVSIMNKAGHSFIKERMIAEDIVFGCETSGHYFFKDNFYLDNGLMPFVAMLEILSQENQPLSSLVAPLKERFPISEEMNFEFKNPRILEDIKNKYQDAQIGMMDGYDFSYPDWRFNVRKSNTENFLRLNLEADSPELLKQKIEEVSGFVEKVK